MEINNKNQNQKCSTRAQSNVILSENDSKVSQVLPDSKDYEKQQQNRDQQQESQKQQGEQEIKQDIYIRDPHDYLSFCQKDKKIKIMDECNPILNHVYLKDISLHKKGPLEDKIYSKNNKYYCNIRRGNTLCQIYDQNQKEADLFMCRRGMKKFYDLEPQYLKVNRKLTHQHERYRKRIFRQLDKILENNESGQNTYKIHIYTLFKQNGEHCQISYVKKLGYWLFASKNVAILAKNEKDLAEHYQKQRFYWAKLIGQQFFRILSEFTQEQKQQFINDIDGKTLLGQHCGYQKHQHITKYDKIQIIFYGLVQNNGVDHCLPVKQCEDFLLKYQLKMSKMQKIENLTQKNKIYFHMYKMLQNIAEGTMDECGQGSVMYLVAQNQKGIQKTIGMCKLKTSQYLIFRRMRQMIKIFFAKKGATANNFQKFKFQINSLCQNYFKPPKPQQYYYQIAQQAFKEVKRNGKDFSDDEFRYKFVNFLDNIQRKARQKKQEEGQQHQQRTIRRVLLICPPLLAEQSLKLQKLSKKYSFNIEYTYRQNPVQKITKTTIHILHMVPRLNVKELLQQQPNILILMYQIEKQQTQKIVAELQQIQDLKKSHLITFLKVEDKNKAIQLLKDKINAFCQKQISSQQPQRCSIVLVKNIDEIIDNILNNDRSQKKTNNKKQQVDKTQNHHQKCLINIIITLLIPGSGKSSLADMALNQLPDQQITIISADKIRQAIMEKYKAKRKGDQVENQQAFAATKKKGLQKYREAIKQAIGQQPPSCNRIIFIDRVFCPTTIYQDILQIHKPWTRFVIVTQVQIFTKFNQHLYPYSLNYLLSCLKRSIQRQQHETLSTKPNVIVKVILKFFQMYRGWNYNKLLRQLDEAQIQYQMLPLQFIKENQQNQNLHLKKKVQDCLKIIAPGHDAPESPVYNELIELIYKYSEHIQRKKTQQTERDKQQMLKNNASRLFKACKI